MGRFDDIDPSSPLYTGPPALSASDNTFSPEMLKPQAPVPASMQNMQSINGVNVKPFVPPPSLGTNFPKASSNTIAATVRSFQNRDLIAADQFKMTKSGTGDFRNPMGGNNFYERYNSVGYRDVYEKLGFSPFRDNEELYNKNTSMWDDWQRAGAQTFANASIAFKDAASFGKLTDTEAATAQQKAMAIGNTTKGGVQGFLANGVLNAGYTFGIIAELAVEEAALFAAEVGLAAATGATLGATAPGFAANTALMASRATRAFGKIKSAYKVASNMRKTLGNLKDANKARTFFKSAANFINPLENTAQFFRGANKVDDLGRLAYTTKGAGAFYADVQQLRLAFGESSLEGGHTQLDMEKNLYSEFTAENGRAPNREEATNIKTLARQAGESTALINMPTILYSNKILFDGLLRPSKPVKDIISKKGKNILFDPKKAAMQNYTKIAPGFMSKPLTYLRNPRLLGSAARKYTAGAIPEGLQEVAQETISGSTKDYYTAQFRGNTERGQWYNMLGDNLVKQVSKEGLHTFMSGFMIPGLIGPVMGPVGQIKQELYSGGQGIKNLSLRYTDPAQWKKVKDERAAKLDDTVEKLNEFYADPAKYLSPDLLNLQQQKAARQGEDDAEQMDDTKTLHDIKDSASFEHITTALEMGRFDTTMERLESMKNISAEDIAESYPHLTEAEFGNIIDKGVKRGKSIQKRWEYATEFLKNPYDSRKKGLDSRAREEEFLQESAWNKAIKELVFNQDTFDRSLERTESILSTAQADSGLANTPYGEFSVMFDFEQAGSELDSLKMQVESLKGEMIEPRQKKLQKEKQTQLELLTSYVDALAEAKVNTVEEKMPAKDLAAIRKSFDAYVDFLGQKNGDFIQSQKLDATFKSIIDYQMLKGRSKKANDAVNILINPKGFAEKFEEIKFVEAEIYANRKNEIRKSLEEFIKVKDKNDMLNELYEAGMFFDPADLVKLEEEGIVPDTFYLTEHEGDDKMEVVANSEQYSKAIQILNKYMDSLTNIDAGQDRSPYNQVGRNKLKNDKRTYDDIAKQFGFDTTLKEKEVDAKIESSRQKEQAELLKAIPNAENYLTDGKVDKEKITNPEDIAKFEEIYDRYDKIISPLLESKKTQQTNNVALETKIPLVQVLQTIIDSPQSTVREKELAKKLMEVSDKNYFVTFVNNATTAGSYSDVTQTVIDARWSSHDYKQGMEGAPIEQVILKQEMHRIASESLSKDASFKAEMKTLMQEARMKYDMLSPEEKRALADPNKRMFEGFTSVEGFVAEAMSNEKFQAFLGTATTASENKVQSGWKSFVDKVLRQIGKMLGGRPSGTVLNAAMNAITAKIDSMYGSITPQASIKSEIKEVVIAPTVTNKMPISELRTKHPKLAQSVLDLYMAENEGRDMRGEDLLDEDYLNKSPEEIFKSTAFIGYFKSAIFKKKEDAISAYNKNVPVGKAKPVADESFAKEDVTDEEYADFVDNNKVSRLRIITIAEKYKNKESFTEKEKAIFAGKVAEIKQYIADSVAEVPSIKTREMKSALRALGYTKNEVRSMSIGEAWRLSYQRLTKEERNQIELADQAEVREEQTEIRNEIRTRIQEEIDSSNTYEELMATKVELLSEMQTNPLLATTAGYTGAELETLINARLEQLAFSVNFDSVSEGEIIMLNDGRNTMVEVTAKDTTGRFIVVQHVKDASKEQYIKESEMEESVKYLYSEALENVEPEDDGEVTNEDQEISNESLEGLEGTDEVDAIVDNLDNENDDDNWDDHINEC